MMNMYFIAIPDGCSRTTVLSTLKTAGIEATEYGMYGIMAYAKTKDEITLVTDAIKNYELTVYKDKPNTWTCNKSLVTKTTPTK